VCAWVGGANYFSGGMECHKYFSAEKSRDPVSRRRAPTLRSSKYSLLTPFGFLPARRRGLGRNAGGLLGGLGVPIFDNQMPNFEFNY
jgi:hypothetical protein